MSTSTSFERRDELVASDAEDRAYRPGFEHAERRISPGGQASTVLRHGRDPGRDNVNVYFSSEALRGIDEHTNDSLAVEVGGVLLGTVTEGDKNLVVEVTASILAETSDQGPSHFTFTADSWAQIHRDRDEQYQDLQIVGWYHSHPDLGAFYSQDDVVVHAAAFVLPWHVSLVVDPVRRELCLIGWRQGEVEKEEKDLGPIPGFYEVLSDAEESAFNWRYVQAGTFYEEWRQPSRPATNGTVYALANSWPSLPAISPWWGVLLAGISLLLNAILLWDRFFSAAG